LSKLRKKGLVEAVEPCEHCRQRFELTAKGRKQLSALEVELNKTISAIKPKQILPDQMPQPLASKESGPQDPASESKVQIGIDSVYEVFSKLDREKVDRYEQQRPTLPGRH
jgi:hypothetical protein